MGRAKPFQFFFNTRGVDQHTGIMYIQPDAADKIENMHVDTLGQWTANNQGFSHYSSQLESGASMDSLAWFTDASGVDYIIAAINGKIKNINPSTGAVTSEISTAYTAGTPVNFRAFKGNLYAATSTLSPNKWAGSGSMSAASGIPLVVGGDTYDKPSIVEQYANRLVYANFNGATTYPSHLAISDDLAPETFTIGTADTNAVVLQVNPGDGQVITALHTMHLPASNEAVLLIFKDRSIYALDGTTPNTFTVYPINPTIGCLNPRCVVQVGPDVLFLDINDIYSVTTATQNGTIQPKLVSSPQVQDTLQNLNITAKDAAWAVHIPQRREVWFAIPTGANTKPDTIIVYHYDQDVDGNEHVSWSIKKPTTSSTFHATTPLLYKNLFYSGSSDGYLNKWFTQSSYAGTGAAWLYRYPFFNFGTQTENKRVVEMYLWFLLVGSETITIRTEWRGGGNNITKSFSKTISPSVSGNALYGSAAPPAGTYGTSYYGDGSVLKCVKIPVLGNGLQLRLTIQGTAGTTGPTFLGVSGMYETGGTNRNYKS